MRRLALVLTALLGCGASARSGGEPGDPGGDAPGEDGAAPAAEDGGAATDGPASPTRAIRILVEPNGHGGDEVVSAIRAAQKSVHMTMFLLTDSAVVDALAERHKAGVDVRVLLSPKLPSGSNQAVFDQLGQAGVAVRWAPAQFAYTHEKCFVVDGQSAWIMTMNATYSAPTTNREYLAVDTDPGDVAEAEAIFAGDWSGQPLASVDGPLVVAPLSAQARLLALLASARSAIDVEVEELGDTHVTDALVAAAKRGVAVRVVLSDATPLAAGQQAIDALRAGGVRLVRLASPYVHAKAIVVDGQTAFVGSENLSAGSLKYNRELGVIFGAPAEVQKVAATIAADFGRGTKI